jgi:hypothetical protein
MLNVQQFMVVAAQMGLGGITPANVYEVAAKVAVGGIRLDQSLAGQADLPDAGRTAGGQPLLTARDKDSPDYSRRLGEQGRLIAEATGRSGLDTLSKSGLAYLREVQGRIDAHGRVEEPGTGQRSAILEGLLKDEKGLKDKHFVVQGPNGPVTVDFEQAFTQYRDQLRRGDVVVHESGQTVAEATGKMGDRTGQVTSTSKEPPKGAGSGAAPAGSVAIYPAPELERILRLVYGGGAYADSARRAGVPAAPFPSDPSLYPSAGPR